MALFILVCGDVPPKLCYSKLIVAKVTTYTVNCLSAPNILHHNNHHLHVKSNRLTFTNGYLSFIKFSSKETILTKIKTFFLHWLFVTNGFKYHHVNCPARIHFTIFS